MKQVIKDRNSVIRARAHLYTVIIKRMKGTEEKMLLYSGPVLYSIAVGCVHTYKILTSIILGVCCNLDQYSYL